MSSTRKLRTNQSGLVSIMVTMILMIVMSLIVIGFAQISRRNQREVLDRQLSTQAFYAAESGVNDVRNLIRTNGTPPAKTDCANTGAFYAGLQPVINAANNVSYSCVLVNPNPTQLQFNSIDNTSSTVIKIQPLTAPIKTLTLTYQPNASVATPVANCPATASNAFVPPANWKCGYGVMRMDLASTDGALDANTLAASTMTTFAVPIAGAPGTTINYAAGTSNPKTLTGVSCNATNCKLNIDNMQVHFSYYLRLSSLYMGVPLQINGTDINGNAVKFVGAQVVVDSTGKAQDVLRRIQAYVSATGRSDRNSNPDNAVSSFGPLCKRFSVTGDYFALDPGIPSSVTADPLSNRLCK
ncbi:MAG TPA: pilus assembly PilX N-terminal domain-containing protein [Candidatus Saccharimonadales bacterium]|nr:pilus assembly PilX N-terminal domain-containing protein [Candidatus Saccharimonadales bacterium]